MRAPAAAGGVRALAALLLLFLVAAASATMGCDKSPFGFEPEPAPVVDPAPAPRSVAPADLGRALDGGVAIERSDPAPPAGDLRDDVARFTSLDACVAQHAVLDPLVGDAVRSLGYDTLLRDACRVLQAIKTKDSAPCATITATGLQHRCEMLLAIALKDPDRCPWSSPLHKRQGRDATCLAVATHDVRSCGAELEGAKPECEALVSGDPLRCGRMTQDERAVCLRDVERLRSTLEGIQGPKDAPPPKALIEIHGANGAADPSVTQVDLSSSVGGGAIVAAEPAGGASVQLARDVEGYLGLPSRTERGRMSVSVLFEAGTPSLTKLEVTAPKLPSITCPSAHCSLVVTMPKAEPTRGAPLSATIEGTVETTAGAYRVKVQVDSFVRDVVARSALYGGR